MKLQPGITAVVTGAANGIGRTTSEALARRGWGARMVDVASRILPETTWLPSPTRRSASNSSETPEKVVMLHLTADELVDYTNGERKKWYWWLVANPQAMSRAASGTLPHRWQPH